ncbi:MAG: glycosyltransferase family 4 protein [Trueperaceae bacterium]|nr:glycosyltransferase family 4 protein [Trueperaceae bacterium]
MASLFLAFITSFISLQLLLKSPWRKRVVAYEDERSMHKGVIPRFGGIGIILGITVGWLMLGVDSWWLLLLLGLSIAFISFLDDLYQLPVWIRLAAQFIMSAVFVYFEFGFSVFSLAALLLISIVWMVNLYNFMDGLDGLAGGMAVFGFSTFAVAAYLAANDIVMLKAAFVVVAATLAFLRWNMHPARLFLGDVGSTSIGFIAAAFSFYGWREGMWPFWFPVVVFMPFIADATVTLLKRFFNGENIWQAHNKHYYQRLARMGWSHPSVSIAYYVAMACSAALAVLLLGSSFAIQLIGLGSFAVLISVVFMLIDWRWHRFQTQGISQSQRSVQNFEADEGFVKESNSVIPL